MVLFYLLNLVTNTKICYKNPLVCLYHRTETVVMRWTCPHKIEILKIMKEFLHRWDLNPGPMDTKQIVFYVAFLRCCGCCYCCHCCSCGCFFFMGLLQLLLLLLLLLLMLCCCCCLLWLLLLFLFILLF